MGQQLLFCIYILFGLVACHQLQKDEEFTVRIRIREDFDCLHPIVSQSSLATQIEALLMLPMIEYSAENLELSPLMVKSAPEIRATTDTSHIFGVEILDDANWDDGKTITAADYDFTVKAALNPYIKNPTWRGFLKNIFHIQYDSSKPKLLQVHVSKDYMLGKEVSGNVNLYPEHVYDPERIMRTFSLEALVRKDSANWTPEEHSLLKRFAEQFESASFCKMGIQGAGPYRLKSWDAGSRIVLERKKNWWGSKYAATNKMLEAQPAFIEYVIMPDEAAAILAVKEGSVDLVTEVSPKQFADLRKDSTQNSMLRFYSPGHFQYALIELNLRNQILQDVQVRKALAKLTNVSSFINDLMMGLADPIYGPIHPIKPYYNKNLKEVGYDPEAAKELLKQAGWEDTDKDGLLDKLIDGKKQILRLRFLASGAISKNISLLLQEEARKLGMEILPETKEASVIRKDLNERNFDLVFVTITPQATTLYDPFQSYHSSNAKPGGGNRCGIQSGKLDSLILGIRSVTDEQERFKRYQEFQQTLFDLQPQIFLFSPHERLLANKRIMMETIKRRPGYLENTFRLNSK
ncbi:MAG: hypothetical protein IPM92_15715 [Saprospiraceae bacterium]|nr:hypothetical protein [Saprospiraceae bacterium]